MTKEQFAEAYAARSGVTVGWLKENGREPAPCDCESDDCEGWQMAFRELLERDEASGFRMLPRDRETLRWLREHD